MAKKKTSAKSDKEITNNELAQLMSKEFGRIHDIHQTFSDEFDRVRSDIRDIKTTLGPLVKMAAMQDREMNDMNLRLSRVERKVGISKR